MAPNRKNVASLELPTDIVEHLQNSIQPKFLPLTDPCEQQQHEELQGQSQQPVTDSASYWDWPADTKAAEEDKPSHMEYLFTTAHIEANLIKDAKKTAAVAATSNLAAAHDDYWCDQVEEEEHVVSQTKPQHDDYWMMPANRTEYREQVAERLTSTDHIEGNLSAAKTKSAPSNINTAQDNYWMWKAENESTQKPQINIYWQWNTLTKREEKQLLIQNILEYERARQLLTADHIEKQMVAGVSHYSNDVVVSTAPSQAGYWDM